MQRDESFNFASAGEAWTRGLRAAAGVASIVMAASFLGFGALVRESGFPLWMGLASTATGWALPGQVALVELLSVGASVFVIASVVALTNARLLPMTVALTPVLRAPGYARWLYYLAAHWIAVTAWAEMMRKHDRIERRWRLPYFFGYSTMLWSTTLAATAAGYLMAGGLPSPVTLGLVFINPIYFMLVFAADLQHRGKVLALGFGAVFGPLLHLLTPDWGLLLAGLLAGSLAFAVERRLKGRSA
jgi:predicted branched-subunit amino acid permease